MGSSECWWHALRCAPLKTVGKDIVDDHVVGLLRNLSWYLMNCVITQQLTSKRIIALVGIYPSWCYL